MNSEKLLELLTADMSVSGVEYKQNSFLFNEISKCSDEVKIDNMGNIIALKKSKNQNAKKIMIAAHMDEIGFVAHFIDEKGFVKVSPIGGINTISCAYTHVVFENGVEGVMTIEENTHKNDLKVQKLYVDLGVKNKKDAEKLVEIGLRCVCQNTFTKLSGSRISSRALDNKAGCALMLEAAQKVESSPYDIYFVFTSQEEVGLRGSKTSAFSIMPDYGIAIDVTDTGDTIGCEPMEIKLGGGAAIKIKDSSAICSPAMVQYLKKLAVEFKIPFQLEILEAGGTDTSSLLLSGSAVSGAISVPTRYIHTAIETIDMKDYNACLKLLIKALEGQIDD